ncbi:flavin-dependent monooxygenase QhpG [Chitinophaga ginsengisoli]|uniref:Flavin-dependent dehydrogenase n=1 Tax=Chitinophaga ginsengisoli TaxID=363837 RepID=A0A2P8FXG8_9BACT|nr:tryptophan 7-halogenase [Chitinophaga ginsengisoli]PSL26401.1 flavin-dependent dehydrogenase [Chitinophaga ginsengisoli]
MTPEQTTDVLIIGAGPAGTCAALRLLALGHKVALAESEPFPRPQIGESLSPGIQNIFDYLDATDLLSTRNYLHQLNAQVIWDTTSPQTVSAAQRGSGVMVDRAQLDKDLLDLAVQRGLQLYQPARFESCKQVDGSWQSQLRQDTRTIIVNSRFILDARGRRGNNMQNRVLTAPPTIAIWGHLPAHLMPADTLVEAGKKGWIWGSPTPNRQFRIITFTDPRELRGNIVAGVFHDLLSETQLFQQAAGSWEIDELQTCTVFTYAHTAPWQDNYLRLGEAAFSLDPLSSTGVEKAMRFSLQAAIAVNTILKTGHTDMARTFFEDRMIESISNHTHWTSGYYAQAWPGQQHAFWKERSVPFIDQLPSPTAFYEKLSHKFTAPREKSPEQLINVQQELQRLWHEPVHLSAELIFKETPCVIDDILEFRTAIQHPNLEREMAYLEAVEISPLLSAAPKEATFGSIVQQWSTVLPFEQAVRIAFFLWDKDILCTIA